MKIIISVIFAFEFGLHFLPLSFGQEQSPLAQEMIAELRALNLNSPKQFKEFKRKALLLVEESDLEEEILKVVSEISVEAKRDSIVTYLLEDIANENPSVVVPWIESEYNRGVRDFDEDAVMTLAQSEPLRMIRLAKKICPLKPREQPTNETDKQLYQTFKYTDDCLCRFEKAVVSLSFLLLADQDIDLALSEAAHWAEHRVYYPRALSQIIQVWSKKDQKAAYAFIKNHPSQEEILTGVLIDNIGLERFNILCREEGIDLEDHSHLISKLSEQLYRETNDPGQVIAWLRTQKDSKEKIDSIRQVIRKWERDDRASCIKWVKSLTNGNMKDEVAIDLIKVAGSRLLSTSEFKSLLDLASSVESKDRLQSALFGLYRSWYFVDSEKALQSLTSDSLLDAKWRPKVADAFSIFDEIKENSRAQEP